MGQDNNIIAYKSTINPEFDVLIIYADHEQYNEVTSDLRKMNSIGALQVGSKTIIIDGEYVTDHNIDKDQILAIEAHEIAHSMLNHNPGYNKEAEKEADLLAVALLNTFEYNRAAEYIKERLLDLYGIDYSAFEEQYGNEFELTDEEMAQLEKINFGSTDQ